MKSCTYASKCRYNHKEYPEGTQVCYECGKTFTTLHDLMKHRKLNHEVRLCREFLNNKCGFSSEDCYNTHAKRPQPETVLNVVNQSKQTVPETKGFWNITTNPAPPSRKANLANGPTPTEWNQMKEQLMHLNKIMSRFI